jgi:hypothetical protein
LKRLLKRIPKKVEIDAIMVLPRDMRVNVLLDYAGVKQREIASRHKDAIGTGTVSLVVTGKGKSLPTSQRIHCFFEESLGDLCPDYDTIFSKDH